MELRQLRYLVTIVEEGGFTRAAERVHVAQPGISAQIRQLERELGQELLDRSGRTVRLTEAGAIVLPLARAALQAVEDMQDAADQLAGLTRGHVRVGMVTSCGVPDLPALLAEFRFAYPGIDITLSEDNAGALLGAVRDGGLDLALTALSDVDPPGLELAVLADEPVVAVVPHGVALTGQDTIELAALTEETLICMPAGSGIRTIFDDACAAAGLRPRVALEATNPQMLAQLAIRGLGVALVPESTARENADLLHELTIVRPTLRGRLAMAWRADGPRSTAARTLVAHVRTATGATA
jgi:DNA-binding transcriptional LysR family regulator